MIWSLIKNINSPFVGYLFDYPLAPYLGNSLAAAFVGFGHRGIATIRMCGQGTFYWDI